MGKEVVTYEETYKKPGKGLRPSATPTLNHLNEGFKCTKAFILKAGVVEKDGKQMEFQEMRVYVEERR